MKALANEIAKNLVLAGVGSLTVLDHEMVSVEDLGAQFLFAEEHVGQNRAQAALPELERLNPRVALRSDQEPALSKPPEYFQAFDVVVAAGGDVETLSSINTSCRFQNRKFYAADAHGMYGFVFADLLSHDFIIERARSNKLTDVNKAENPTRTVISSSTKQENGKVTEVVRKREVYSPLILANTSSLPPEITNNRRKRLQVTPLLSCFRALFDFQKANGGRLPSHSHSDLELFTTFATEKHRELSLPPETLRSDFLRSFLQNLGAEIAPVVAFLGGALAQDLINVLTHREQPLQNFLLFDGEDFKGPIYSLHPVFPDTLPMVVPPPVTEAVPLAASTEPVLQPDTSTADSLSNGIT